MAWKKLTASEMTGNLFDRIGKQWFLLTAGTEETGYNPMTCSWGMAGILWNKPSVTCYVRKSRHTFGFMERQDIFTVSFLPETQRKALSFCGSHSGRDGDKPAQCGLTPEALDGAVTFAEAELVFVCRKRYAADISPADLPADVRENFYGSDDAHKMYIGEITAVYQKD
ncbi:MAG: flavin reductase [Oscillospiraceae bacterium]|nr:flavin reductase [Oscillospiraceae bacterium]MCR5307276.1 flavin reductase [Oscillospiraceae bacterium]